MKGLFLLLLLSAGLVHWSHDKVTAAHCNGFENARAEFQYQQNQQLPEVRQKNWQLQDLSEVSQRLEKFKDGSYRFLPPVNISSLKRQVDRLLLWGEWNSGAQNFQSELKAQTLSIDHALATISVILERLEGGDRCTS